MRSTRITLILIVASTLFAVGSGQTPQGTPGSKTVSVDEIIERMGKSEMAVLTRMKAFHPLVEVYIQNLAPDEQLGTVPTQDEYFLGQFDFKDGPKLRPLSVARKGSKEQSKGLGIQYLPDGFAAMSVPDWRLLDASKYDFKFIKREFLGETRCVIFEV